MTLDMSGYLLEGARAASGNGQYTYPLRSAIASQSALDASPGRADYMLLVSGQGAWTDGIEIADPALKVLWTRSDEVARFDYDSFARRWDTLPGGAPEAIGLLSNSPRLRAPVPVPGLPYAVYIGHPARIVTFSVTVVGSESAFTDPAPGTVQVASDAGTLNFSSSDLSNELYAGQQVRLCRQRFTDRQRSGPVGSTPASAGSAQDLFLSPIPAAGQVPRVRIGLGRHLSVSSVATEGALYDPPAGSALFALDTGALRLSSADVAARPSTPVYYDGVLLGQAQLSRGSVGAMDGVNPGSLPAGSAVDDPTRYVFFFVAPGAPAGRQFWYLTTALSSSVPSSVAPGTAVVHAGTRAVYISQADVDRAYGAQLQYVDTYLPVERGVSVQLFRSAANGPGFAEVPDFVETYAVADQVLSGSIGRSPMESLTAMPVDDGSLAFRIEQGDAGGGTYRGPLPSARSASSPGPCHTIDAPTRTLRYGMRRSVSLVLAKPASSVKLPDAAIFQDGMSVSVDGVPLQAGSTFAFDSGTGLADFVTPVGEGEDANKLGISGSAAGARFTSAVPSFGPEDLGLYLLCASGPNRGLRQIVEVLGATRVTVSPPFVQDGPDSADVRAKYEVVADRFWSKLSHVPGKLKVELVDPATTAPTVLGEDDYSVIPGAGQVNLKRPARPGHKYRVEYVSLESEDGVSFTAVPRSEHAGFKVRQELATLAPGSSSASFNPDGNTVLETHEITVSVDGVTQSKALYRFEAPGTLVFGGPVSGEVVVDYWVAEAPGGNTTFRVLHAPMDVDLPSINSEAGADPEPVTRLNGDQTDVVRAGGAVLVDGKDLLSVHSASYDPATGLTSVVFRPPPAQSYSGVPMTACGPGDEVAEDAEVDVLVKGTSTLTVKAERHYPRGTLLKVDGDPYLVIASQASGATTTVSLSAPASRNYITPSVLRSVRPVHDRGSSFRPALPIHPGRPATVVVEPSNDVLRAGSGLTVSDGGDLVLDREVGDGDRVLALYVARRPLPAGTQVSASYSCAASPDESNGLAGQKLLASYSLYAPDTFYYRVESVVSMVPEIVESLRRSASSGGGPNIASRAALKVKDMGSKSPWHDEQHELNVDVVIRRLLKLYNDVVNSHEDSLALWDGRVVGGTSGRFRYDGSAGAQRASYSEVTNDIDDSLKLYDKSVMTGFFTFSTVPVYAPLHEYGPQSRLFPTSKRVAVALNSEVGYSKRGSVLGSIGVQNLTHVGPMTQSLSCSAYSLVSGSTVRIRGNGGTDPVAGKLSSAMPVKLYSQYGKELGSSTIVAVTDNIDGTTDIVLATPPASARGSVVRDVTVGDPKIYSPGRDVDVDLSSGQVLNASLPSIFSATQVSVDGNEIVDVTVSFAASSTSPFRFPALDGSSLTDSGRPCVPALSYFCEAQAVEEEIALLDRVCSATVALDKVTLTVTAGPVPAAGSQVRFAEGPNAGITTTVSTVVGTVVTLVAPLPASSPSTARALCALTLGADAKSSLTRLMSLIDGAAAAAPGAGESIGALGSHVSAASASIALSGTAKYVGSVSVSGSAFTAGSDLADAGVTRGCVLHVTSSASRGAYLVESVSGPSGTVSAASPWAAFPAAASGASASVIAPWPFLGTARLGAVSAALRSELAFYAETAAWQSSFSYGGVAARRARLVARLTEIRALASSLEEALKTSDKLYDARYLWIQQRTDKKDGTLSRYLRAVQERSETLAKIAADQQRMLVASRLT